MEPIPYFFDNINRNAILVRPKKPFYGWVNAVDSEDDQVYEEKKEDHNIYLLKTKRNIDEVRSWLKQNFDMIFQNELNDWHTSEEDWPQARTYTMFCEWFDVEVHSMLLDLEDSSVRKN